MKTILKFSLAVFAAMTTMSTYADNGDILLNVKQGNGKEISFAINQIQRVNVTITDKSHNIIFSETVTGKEGIFKTYSLEEFPEGTYFLEVVTNSKKVTHEIVVTKSASILSRRSVQDQNIAAN